MGSLGAPTVQWLSLHQPFESEVTFAITTKRKPSRRRTASASSEEVQFAGATDSLGSACNP